MPCIALHAHARGASVRQAPPLSLAVGRACCPGVAHSRSASLPLVAYAKLTSASTLADCAPLLRCLRWSTAARHRREQHRGVTAMGAGCDHRSGSRHTSQCAAQWERVLVIAAARPPSSLLHISAAATTKSQQLALAWSATACLPLRNRSWLHLPAAVTLEVLQSRPLQPAGVPCIAAAAALHAHARGAHR